MFKRPFTCIFTRYGKAGAMIVDATGDCNQILATAKENLPGATIIAMVPGVHAGHTYIYGDEESSGGRKTKTVEMWPDNITPGF